jgi:hypothetical protein
MTRVTLKIVGRASGEPTIHDGRYVIACDVDANGGRGELLTVSDRRLAAGFDDAPAALEYWQRVSQVDPLRDDGRPNRPLTAYTVAVEPIT